MRRAAQEGEVGEAVELGVGGHVGTATHLSPGVRVKPRRDPSPLPSGERVRERGFRDSVGAKTLAHRALSPDPSPTSGRGELRCATSSAGHDPSPLPSGERVRERGFRDSVVANTLERRALSPYPSPTSGRGEFAEIPLPLAGEAAASGVGAHNGDSLTPGERTLE